MQAKRVQIVTDSAADLPPEVAGRLKIRVVPLRVSMGDERFNDGELSTEEFISAMEEEKELPKTSQPSPGAFMEVFEECGGRDPILCLTLSSKLSGTYHAALIASQAVEAAVSVFDTLAATGAEAAQVLKAVNLARQGLSIEEMVRALVKYRDRQSILIGMPNVGNLVKGGRLSRWQGRLADILGIGALLEGREGEIKLREKVIGLDNLFDRLWQVIEEEVNRFGELIGDRVVGISHTCAGERARDVANRLKAFGPADLLVTSTGGVISTYAGRGTVVVGI